VTLAARRGGEENRPVRGPRVAVIEGEDAAPEALRPSLELLRALAPGIEWVFPPVGRDALERLGSAFPDEARAAIDASDATLFGATSGASAQALFYLRWGRETFANVRPVRWFPGCRSPLARPRGIDLAIVRENLEDLYVGLEGELAELAPLGLVSRTARRPVAELGPGRFAIKVITEAGCARVARFAFALARRRRERGRPGRVTCGTKHNMLPRSDGLFLEVARSVAREHPDVEFESFIIDDFARRLVAEPASLDVVVLPNLYGDILSDAAAGLVGGLGLAPSGCYGERYAYFEPAHGTAPDLAGKGVINPTATLLSAAMMLEHLGAAADAARLVGAIERVYARGEPLTPDQGGSASTREFVRAVSREL
jgi:isocitrate/isopropylmalate dehydrogenase